MIYSIKTVDMSYPMMTVEVSIRTIPDPSLAMSVGMQEA